MKTGYGLMKYLKTTMIHKNSLIVSSVVPQVFETPTFKDKLLRQYKNYFYGKPLKLGGKWGYQLLNKNV
jgi:hypothetical protein